jgi:hypothetical protein
MVDEAESAAIRALGQQIQTLFEGRKVDTCVNAMCELLASQAVQLAKNHSEARENADDIHDRIEYQLKIHAEAKWGRKH